MAKHILPIKSTYVSRWGLWESVRELIQNAKDEEEENGSRMEVAYRAGALHIINHGAQLGASALLIGETSKAGKKGLRGEHGEGLDLAFLAGVRANYKIKVHTGDEVWTPKLERVKAFGHCRCLVISTRKTKHFAGVHITIELPKPEWLSMRKRFLFLDPPEITATTSDGELLCDESRKGHIYVKGIYVMTSHEATAGFGFNFFNMRLDRDRQMIGSFDLQWAMGRIVGEALGKDPAHFVRQVMGLLDKDSEEIQYLSDHLSKGSEGAQAVAQAFTEEHGPEAIPVRSMAESEILAGLGAKGVVVSDAAHKVLSPELGSCHDKTTQLRQQPSKRYGWEELTQEEQQNLNAASEALASVTDPDLNVKAQLQIVDFPDDSIFGLCKLESGEIFIARHRCADYYNLVSDMLHELAHAITKARDGTRLHVSVIEDLWTSLYRAEREAARAAAMKLSPVTRFSSGQSTAPVDAATKTEP